MYKTNHSLSFVFLLLFLFSTNSNAQKNYQAATIAFYNVENLFDTIVSVGYIDGTKEPNDPEYHIQIPKSEMDNYESEHFSGEFTYENLKGKKVFRYLILQEDEFSPKGNKAWSREKQERKLHQLAKVIYQVGREESGSAPVIVGLSEVETREVVEDLANQPLLQPYGYEVIHFNSFDARGIDLALMYQKSRFKVTLAKSYPIFIYRQDSGRRIYTRDILRVSG
jgi:hypothetical protein